MASDWREYKLSEIGRIITGKTPATSVKENFGNDYPFLTPKDMHGQKWLRTTDRGISQIGKQVVKNYVLPANAICVSCIGSDMGKVVMIDRETISNQQINSIICKATFYPDFVFYALKHISPEIKNIGNHSTAVPIVNKTDFSNFTILVPELFAQCEIASILSALDDKIELNRRTNETLEETAKAIFKEWFVNFNYPGATGKMQQSELGETPEGWSVVAIGELFDFVIGGDWGKEILSEDFPEECYVIRGTDFGSIMEGNVGKVPKRFIKTSNFKKRKLQSGDILLEISGGSTNQATGRNIIITEDLLNLFDSPVIPASFCRLIRSGSLQLSTFLAIYLKDLYDRGGTWDYQLQSTGISNFQFQFFVEKEVLALPPDNILAQFEEIMNPIIKMNGNAINEIQQLTFIRDSLLPKLMTGEIEVTETAELKTVGQ